MEKQALILVRGLPGSGKTEFAKTIADGKDKTIILSTDNYFTDPNTGEYKFDARKLGAYHQRCFEECYSYLEAGWTVIVANTFTRKSEMENYLNAASELDVRVYTIVVEHRHDGTNIHNVPAETIKSMYNRFEIKLGK